MKRLSLILTILGFVIAAELAGLTWVKDYTNDLSAELTALSRQEDILPRLEEIRGEWDSRRRIMSIFLHERTLDHFEESLTDAALRIRTDETDAAFWLQTAADAAKGIWESERPDLQNIL